MFHRITVSVFILFIVLLGISTNAWQETSVSATEKQKDERQEVDQRAIKEIMANGTFKAYIQDGQKFCSDFLKDFSQQKNISYINPIIEADNCEDKRLQAVLGKCPHNEFNITYVIYHPSMMNELTEAEARGKKISNRDMEELGGVRYEATKNYRLFKVDIDNDTTNGDEYVLYAEGYFSKERNAYWYNTYTIIDLINCEVVAEAYVGNPDNLKNKSNAKNYNGIIRYRGKYYIYDLQKNNDTRLILIRYSKNNNNLNSLCGYSKSK